MSLFEDIEKKIYKYAGRIEEYLLNRYPKDYFSFYIDIGSRGNFNPWHLNYLAKDNPKTKYYGFEPDLPYYQELVDCKKSENLDNIVMSKKGFGTGAPIKTPYGEQETVTITKIIEENKLSANDRWALKIDCEGGEYCLMKEECKPCVELMKACSHIAIEFHLETCRTSNNFWTTNQNRMPTDISYVEKWLEDNFSDSHKIYLTDQSRPPPETQGLYTYVIVKNEVMEQRDSLFWSELLLS